MYPLGYRCSVLLCFGGKACLVLDAGPAMVPKIAQKTFTSVQVKAAWVSFVGCEMDRQFTDSNFAGLHMRSDTPLY